MKTRRMRALVTGGAGFIGSHLCEELLERGFRVMVLDNFATSLPENVRHLRRNPDFRFHRGSILNQSLVERLVKDSDIVYHLAAAVGVKLILEHVLDSLITNVEGSESVLRLAAKHGKKVVIASSSEVYGKHGKGPMREEDDRVLGPTSVARWSYADSKALDEFMALAYASEKKLSVVIVRFFNVVGPRQSGRYGMVFPRFIQEALSGRPITVYGDGRQIRSFTYVKDAVRAVADLSLSPKAEGKIFNVGSDRPISIRKLAQCVKEKAGSPSRIVFRSYRRFYGSHFEDAVFRLPDISRIRKTVGFCPRYDVSEAIEKTIDYFKQEAGKH